MAAYLDHAATSPIRPEIAALISHLHDQNLGNPSGKHGAARRATAILDTSREEIATIVGGDPGGVIFTSCGTESDNLAIFGVLQKLDKGGKVVISQIEHRAVLVSAEAACDQFGFELIKAPVGVDGVVDVDRLNELIDESVVLVSIMASNNELGTIEPISEISKIVRKNSPHALVHSDAVQAAGWLPISEIFSEVDMISLSAHKLGGPVGVGALVTKKGLALSPHNHGGGQERGRRSGTVDVVGAASLSAALKAVNASEWAKSLKLTQSLEKGLKENIKGLEVTVSQNKRVPGTLHVIIQGVEGEEVLFLLDEYGVAASAGSACSSGSIAPSHVLQAIGGGQSGTAAIRFSLGWSSNQDEINEAIVATTKAVEQLRSSIGISK
ncbi:MAG: cysteine desulfurase [Acidimicrobiales bacterium]|nr:cysteine desulfurase [Acidimicrobiales bacterium]